MLYTSREDEEDWVWEEKGNEKNKKKKEREKEKEKSRDFKREELAAFDALNHAANDSDGYIYVIYIYKY